jgi:hypothetical protein
MGRNAIKTASRNPRAERIKCCCTEAVHTPSEAEYKAIVPMITSINIPPTMIHGMANNLEVTLI